MSECLANGPLPLPEQRLAKPAAKRGFAVWFTTALESLVAAQSRRIDENASLMFRYPPI